MKDGITFLRLNNCDLIITDHARARLCRAFSKTITFEEARAMFETSTQISYQIVMDLGFRVRYGNRKRKGENSWYFIIRNSPENEIIAVIGTSESYPDPAWITTLSATNETSLRRIGTSIRPVHQASKYKHINEVRHQNLRHAKKKIRERRRTKDEDIPEIKDFLSREKDDLERY